MNFRRLVEEGKYSKQELKAEDKAFIDGMEWVLNEVIDRELRDIEDYYELADERNPKPTYAKLMSEIEREEINDLKESIIDEICQVIVSMIDHSEEGKQEEY